MKKTVHLMTGSSTVKCGQKMGHWKDNPDGWYLDNVSTEVYQVTCMDCAKKWLESK